MSSNDSSDELIAFPAKTPGFTADRKFTFHEDDEDDTFNVDVVKDVPIMQPDGFRVSFA